MTNTILVLPLARAKMMEMINGFTILRMVNMMGMMSDMQSAEKPVITKEMLLELNAKLNQV